MNNIIRLIKSAYLENSPEDVLDEKSKYERHVGGLNEEAFVSYVTQREPLCYNNEEVGLIYQNMLESVNRSDEKALNIASSIDILKLPLVFTKDKNVLRMINHQPVCRYEQFLNWRMLSFKTGEDLLTTAFLAEEENLLTYERQIFDWKPLITNDNERLEAIVSKGISENHYHLKGSAPHFDLSWISLMNQVKNRDEEIEKLKKSGFKLNPQIDIHSQTKCFLRLDEKLVIAAAIRYYFYAKNTKELNANNKALDHLPQWLDDGIQKLLSFTKTKYDFKAFKDELNMNLTKTFTLLLLDLKTIGAPEVFGKWQKADYFIKFPSKIEAYEHWTKDKVTDALYKGNRILSGERRFQYLTFKALYANILTEKEATWFYAYQLIKLQFRAEFVQINDHVGFYNFSQYQNRKTYFIPKRSIYEEGLFNLSINSVLEDQHVRSLECRIGPENTKSAFIREINQIDKFVGNKSFFYNQQDLNPSIISPKPDNRYFYTIHFIKEADKNFRKEIINKDFNVIPKLSYQCRNYDVRKLVKMQAKALGHLRKSGTDSAHRILGIDAANFEIGCRPEVFAQAFRFLRSKQTSEYSYLLGREVNDRIGVTFHAGEDFIDVADGLRAIGEALRFLELKQGDRIGHALALGIDPFEYYDHKSWEIPTRKQDALDNCVWMFAMMRKYGITSPRLHEHLRKLIMDLASMIYGSKMGVINISPELLYDAWKLRGDNPELYSDYGNHDFSKGMYGIKVKKSVSIQIWDSYSEGYLDTDEKALRDRVEVGYLNYIYHYDFDTKANGYQTYIMKIEKDYANVVEKIQFSIQKEISKKNIGIEANPSSNFVIGTFKRYVKHPMIRFNNFGIEAYQYKDQKNLQLFVSINTDDQGVFGTYLENEYALMALALEKEKDEHGNPRFTTTQIYEWIDKIRGMGNEQSFRNRIKGINKTRQNS